MAAERAAEPAADMGVLCVGTLMTVGFADLLSLRSVWSQGPMVVLVTALDGPLGGVLRGGPGAFRAGHRHPGRAKAGTAP